MVSEIWHVNNEKRLKYNSCLHAILVITVVTFELSKIPEIHVLH